VEFALLPARRALTLQLHHAEVLPLGQPIEFAVTATPAGDLRAFACDVELEVSGGTEPLPPLRLLLHGDQPVRASLLLTPERRGHLHVHALHARWTGPLKLLWLEQVEHLDRTIRIVVD